MPVIRQHRIDSINAFFANETKRWTPLPRSRMSDYLAKCGIFHLFQVDETEAKNRLLDLHYLVRFIESWDSFVKPFNVFCALRKYHLERSLNTHLERLYKTCDAPIEMAKFGLTLTDFFLKAGRLDIGEKNAKMILNILDTHLPAYDPLIFEASDLLLTFYRRNEHRQKALNLGRQLYEDKVSALGKEDPSTIRTRLELGDVLRIARRYQEARDLYQELLKTSIIKGTDQGQFGNILGKIAGVCKHMKDHYLGEIFAQRQVTIYQSIYKEMDIKLLTAQNQWADLLRLTQQYVESERVYLDVLQKRVELLGEEHPGPLTTIGGLGKLYSIQERYQEAEFYMSKDYHLSVEVYGARHIRAIQACLSLAEVYNKQGKFAEAETLIRSIYQLQKRHRGLDYQGTDSANKKLVEVLHKQGKHTEIQQLRQSEKAHVQTQKIFHELLCELDEPRRIYHMMELTLRDLLDVHKRNSNHEGVLTVAQRLHTYTQRFFGDEHSKTIHSLMQIAWAQYKLGMQESSLTFELVLTYLTDISDWKHHYAHFGKSLSDGCIESAGLYFQKMSEMLGTDHKQVQHAQRLYEDFKNQSQTR